MNTIQIDKLNTFLILLSFGLAYLFPFELFLLVYAVLGPLHYFTEINWIKDKDYFVKSKIWIYLTLIFTLLIAIPGLLKFSNFNFLNDYPLFRLLRYGIPKYSNHLIFLLLITAFSLLFWKKRKQQIFIIFLGILIALAVHQFKTYHIIIGILLPTIIHVYVFTILFMWYGNLKEKKSINYLNLVLMLLIPLFLFMLNIDNGSYHFSETTKSLIGTHFYKLNHTILNLFGLEKNPNLFFYDIANLKIQIFIAFAYTYHYLNWFSKTTVIGWHKKLTQKKSILIGVLWLLSVGLYFYNYSIGLAVLLFLSLLHVILEFPLNIITIKEVLKKTP